MRLEYQNTQETYNTQQNSIRLAESVLQSKKKELEDSNTIFSLFKDTEQLQRDIVEAQDSLNRLLESVKKDTGPIFEASSKIAEFDNEARQARNELAAASAHDSFIRQNFRFAYESLKNAATNSSGGEYT